MALRIPALGTPRPHFLEALAVTLLVAGIFLLGRNESLTPPPASPQLTAAVLPGAVVALTNEERNDSGLGSLKANALLNRAAQLKADDMAAKSYYAHVSPDGTIPPAWLNKVGYKYEIMGENLVVDRENSEAVVSAWMGSENHRENILNPKFTEIGIGVANGNYKDRDTIYVVQMLARPLQAAPAPRVVVEPKPVQVRPTPTTPVPTRSAATTSVLVRPPAPKPVVRDTIKPVIEAVASTTLIEVPSIVDDVTILPSPVSTPYTSEPVELNATTTDPRPVRTPIRARFRSFMNEVGAQMLSFFSPIL